MLDSDNHTLSSGSVTEWYAPADRSDRFVSDAATMRWLSGLRSRLYELSTLQPGWDSYGGLRIDLTSIELAWDILIDPVLQELGEPSIVPTSDGHVQAEWSLGDMDLEIEFSGATSIEVYMENRRTGVTREETLSYDLRPLRGFVEEMIR